MVDQILQELEKKGYSYVSSLLDGDHLSAINQFFEDHKDEFHPARVGTGGQKLRVNEVRGDYTFWLDPLAPQVEFKPLFELLETLKEAVNASFFMGLKQYECHLAYYPPGTFYNKHLDRFQSDSSRTLSFIFYLNREWSKEDGGELLIYNKSGMLLETIYPMPGSFITFLSEEFPHEVRPALKERRSFTGWMHTKILY